MMKKLIGILFLLFGMVLFGGCVANDEADNVSTYVYYLNPDGYCLEQDAYEISGESTKQIVKELLEELKRPSDQKELKSLLPKEVEIEKFEIKDKCLELHFNGAYTKMKKNREVLLRAGIVQTMTQIDGIDFVTFYVGNDVLKDRKGIPVGMMSPDNFVQDTGSSLNSYRVTTLQLYFANADGTKLVREKISNVHYSSNISIEKLIMEQLIKGPTSDKAHATIPTSTKVLGVSVKDGICYVNLDGSFLTEGYNQKPEIPIYSIVNSIIENGNANRVQILINGSSDENFKGSIKLDRPLEWNKNVMEDLEE